jgi:EmrB/QacA subfamily drug resistance transporter
MVENVVSESKASNRLVLGGLLAGLLLGFMDVTIVSTTGPTIISDLGGLSLYAWPFTSFIIVLTVSVLIFGKLSDLYGRKRLYLLGVVVFMAGSALSGASENIYELILFRAIQGIGFGAFLPTTVAIAGDMFPPEKRGKVQGLLFSINGVAFAVAPALGSFLTDAISWRGIFYINLPVGIISLLFIYSRLKESKAINDTTTTTPFADWIGTAMLSGFLSLLIFGFYLGGSTFAWWSWQEICLFVGAGVILAGFIAAERRAKEPLLPPRLFQIRNVVVASAVNILRAAVFFGMIAFVPLYVQAALGAGITDVRNVVYTFTLPFTAGVLLAGAAISRFGFKKLVYVGSAVTVGGMVLLNLIGAPSQQSITQLMEILVPIGFGNGLMLPALIVAFQNSVHKKEIGVASGLASFTLFLGGAIGVAILGAIQANLFGSQLSGLASYAPSSSKAIISDPDFIGHILASPHALSQLLASNQFIGTHVTMLREAFSHSIFPLFLIELGVSIATLVVVVCLRDERRSEIKKPNI